MHQHLDLHLQKEKGLGWCLVLVHFSYIYQNAKDLIIRIFWFIQCISNDQFISLVASLLPTFSPPHILALLAGRKVKDVETQANLLFDRLKPLKMLEENLSRNLSEIKLLISQARKQAASVSAQHPCSWGSWNCKSQRPPVQRAFGHTFY